MAPKVKTQPSTTTRQNRLGTSAAGMSDKALRGLGTKALQNIKDLGNLGKFASRAGEGRRATKTVRAILKERNK